MSDTSTRHHSYTIERTLNASPAQVFKAWTEPGAKSRWFSGPREQWREHSRESNIRVGGREHLVGAWQDGRQTIYDARYLDIVPGERIVYVYDMFIDQKRISISLATVQIAPVGAATRLQYTEQEIFLDGHEDGGGREKGTRVLFDQLEASLRVKPLA